MKIKLNNNYHYPKLILRDKFVSVEFNIKNNNKENNTNIKNFFNKIKNEEYNIIELINNNIDTATKNYKNELLCDKLLKIITSIILDDKKSIYYNFYQLEKEIELNDNFIKAIFFNNIEKEKYIVELKLITKNKNLLIINNIENTILKYKNEYIKKLNSLNLLNTNSFILNLFIKIIFNNNQVENINKNYIYFTNIDNKNLNFILLNKNYEEYLLFNFYKYKLNFSSKKKRDKEMIKKYGININKLSNFEQIEKLNNIIFKF